MVAAADSNDAGNAVIVTFVCRFLCFVVVILHFIIVCFAGMERLVCSYVMRVVLFFHSFCFFLQGYFITAAFHVKSWWYS